MRPKGIKFIELIADKIFLAIFAVIFLAVVALQFVGGGTAIKIGAQDNVPIDRAYQEVITLAQRKQAAMTSDDVAEEAPTTAPDVAGQLEVAMVTSTADSQIPPIVAVKPLPGASGIDGPPAPSGRYALPKPPAPTRPVAESFGGALDPYELKAAPGLASSLLNGGEQQPYDIFAISVESEFDASDYRRILESDPDGAGALAALPRNWWIGRVEVLDVQLFRREVFPDGTTGDEVLLATPPGFASMRNQLSMDLTVGELNKLVRFAEQPEQARQIRQPFFYRMISGEAWSPPLQGDGAADDMAWSSPPARLRDVDVVSIWAHDVSATPGASYQYRMSLVFPNPLKGYEKSIDEDLRHLAEAPVIVSAPSPWSDTVQTLRPAYNFVQRASIPQQGAVGPSRPFAIVELYRFYYGYWRRGEMRVHAGDMIASDIAIPMALPIWSVDGQQPQREGEVAGPIPADTGAYLLDVVVEPSPAPPGPGGRTQTRNAAIIGTIAGDVAVRRPDEDSQSALKAQLQKSANVAAGAVVETPQARSRAVAPAGQAAPAEASQPRPDGRREVPSRLGGGAE